MTFVASWNVNGLRAVINKGFFEYLELNPLDIICLQEIKSFSKDVDHLLNPIKDRFNIYLNSALRPGYSGTGQYQILGPILFYFFQFS